MKKIITTCLTLGLISPLYAETYGTSPGLPPSGDSAFGVESWFAGAGADYMFNDFEELYLYGQVGCKLNSQSALFLEAGWIGSEGDFGGGLNVDVDIIPVTLNYSYEFAINDQLSVYLGGGLGAANADVEANFGGISEDEWVFMMQGFAGLIYEFTPALEGYVGMRYMWLDDPFDVSLDGFGMGAGVRFNF